MTIYSFCVNQHQFALNKYLRCIHSLAGALQNNWGQININSQPTGAKAKGG